MTDDATVSGPLPAVPYIKGAGTDDPYLEGMACSDCGAVFLGERDTCSSCGGRDTLEKKRLGVKHGNGEKEEQKRQPSARLFGLQPAIGMGRQGAQRKKSDQSPIKPFGLTEPLQEEQ